MERAHNSRRLEVFFREKLAEIGYDGVLGVAGFRKVFDELIPIQRNRLKDICKNRFEDFRKNGSIICIGIAYPAYAIDCIDVRLSNGNADKRAWNRYAAEYHKLNTLLTIMSKDIAECFDGVPIPPTVEGARARQERAYHKQEIGCALRFTSIMTSLPLVRAERVRAACGNCKACFQACSFLRNKDKLENYRENCRRYIMQLGLKAEVCGKCVKACYRRGRNNDRFRLRN